jgi:hypothetical protein
VRPWTVEGVLGLVDDLVVIRMHLAQQCFQERYVPQPLRAAQRVAEAIQLRLVVHLREGHLYWRAPLLDQEHGVELRAGDIGGVRRRRREEADGIDRAVIDEVVLAVRECLAGPEDQQQCE